VGDALRTYSRVLQMRPDTLSLLIKTKPGYGWALRMFIIVSLIAGLGLWFGLGELLSRQTLVEGLDAAAASAGQVESAVQGALVDLASGDLAAAPARLLAGIRAQAAPLLGRARGAVGELVEGVPPLDEGGTAAQARALALAKLQPLARAIGASEAQLAGILANANLTPEQLSGLLARFRLDVEQLGERLSALKITADEIDALFMAIRAEAVNAQPILGVRPSRVIRLGGEWLSTPLEFAANWLLIALALLLAARSLHGKGSVREHLTAMLLATAPAILMVGLYVPPVAATAGIPIALALHLFTRLLALIGVIWGLILLVRTLATAHEFSNWRAIGAMALTAILVVVVLPLTLTAAGGFLLAF